MNGYISQDLSIILNLTTYADMRDRQAANMEPIALRETTTQNILLLLGKAVWNWHVCEKCETTVEKVACEDLDCASQYRDHLSRYFSYYRDLVAQYIQFTPFREPAGLKTHQDLFNIIQVLKENPVLSKAELMEKLFPDGTIPSSEEKERVINLAVRILTMLNCTSAHQSALLRQHGLEHPPWTAETPLDQFFMSSFPAMRLQGTYSGVITKDIKHSIAARRLKRAAGLRIAPTDEISNHLKLDKQSRVLYIFHHCGFLKENLRAVKDKGLGITATESLRLGCIPSQLALEVLDSIQNILFPLSDAKSYSLLDSLITSSLFDPSCRHVYIPDTPGYYPEDGVRYIYFSHRLKDLYDEVSDPGPQSAIGKWLDRKKGARHVMMATLVGVVVAVLLGILTLGVSGYQAWLAYQQWQHPISDSP